MDYKKAGVDIEAGYKSVELMKEHVPVVNLSFSWIILPVAKMSRKRLQLS